MRTIFRQVAEAAYEGNLGFEEMVRFYRTAQSSEIAQLEKLLRGGKFRAAWALLKQVTGVALRKLR